MANTFSQLYFHFVFAVKGRQNLIPHHHKDELYKYISGITRNKDQKLLAINGMPDHLHILVNLKPDVAPSAIIRDIKALSSKFINERQWFPGKFNWQDGYGVFTYSLSQIDDVVQYIRNQEKHHHKQTFKEEFLTMLERFKVEHNEEYLFEWLE